MDLTENQRKVILVLTTEWQTPIQIADQLPEAPENLSVVQQTLKDLLSEGLIQTNPVVLGLYRLTDEGKMKKQIVFKG